MARETKVGLLAGLAFIICFAVILANRGRLVPPPEQPQTTRFQFAQAEEPAQHTKPPTTPRRTAQGAPQNRPLAADNGSETPRSDGSPLQRPMPRDEEPVHQPSAGRMADSQSMEAQDDADARIRDLEERLNELSQAMAAAKREDIPLAASTGTDVGGAVEPGAAEVRRTERQAASPAETMVSESGGRPPERINDQRPRPVRMLARHKVEKGDTLSRIAAAYYNAKSKRFIDALMDANRGVLSDPNLLKVGMELMIPVVDGVQQVSAAPPRRSDETRDRHADHPSTETRKHLAPFRWYQIQKDDRYMDIAERELGDKGRWREIFELNKAVFPDPAHIRAGVRIKLPAVAVADTREGRRP